MLHGGGRLPYKDELRSKGVLKVGEILCFELCRSYVLVTVSLDQT